MSAERVRHTGRGEAGPVDGPAPTDARLPDGQHVDHWMLSEEERAKGFVRPVRRTYRHVGVRPTHALRDLTFEEARRHAGRDYVKYEEYPESESPRLGRYWTRAQLDSGCGTETTMPLPLAETIARDPSFYGATFCAGGCGYRAVEEFVWTDDETRVGS